MANPNSGNVPICSHEQHWPVAIAALAVGTAFFSLWFWLLPHWLGFHVEAGATHWRWLAALPSVLGFAVALRCVWDFGWTGHGTPAPIAPPQRLVVVGFYATCAIPCTWGSQRAGSGYGLSSDTPTYYRSPLSQQLLLACICS
jgi:hypothetical protein